MKRVCDSAVLYSLNNSIKCLDKVLGAEYDIGTGLDAAYDRLVDGVLLRDGPHIHGIGYDDVLIAQFATQLLLQDFTSATGAKSISKP